MIETANLKGVAAKGLFWSAMERFGAQSVQFIFGIMITRILMPSDYGLLGMILIFMAVGQTLIDSGFGSALIWKKNPTTNDYSTVFYFNISISFVLYAVFFFVAPAISRFYNEPLLVDLIRVISLNFIILSFSLIQQTILQKKVDFKLMAFINIAGSLLAGLFALIMAIKGFGVWSIVIQILIKSFITSILLWIYNKWRPVFAFSLISLKELFNYGSKLTGAGLIYTIFQYFYFNLIGKLFPVEALGFYTRAAQLQEFPVKTIASIFHRVAFPVFSAIQDENERLRNAVSKTVRTAVFIIFPVLFGLMAVANPLIEVLLTAKWLPSALYFKLLCVVGLFYIFQAINGEILKTKGKSGWVLRVEIVTKTIMVINIIITWQWGITAIILGHIIAVFTAYLMSSIYVSKLIGYSIWQQWKDISAYLALAGIMFLLVVFVPKVVPAPLLSLTIMTVVGLFFYIFMATIFKLDEISEIKKLIGR